MTGKQSVNDSLPFVAEALIAQWSCPSFRTLAAGSNAHSIRTTIYVTKFYTTIVKYSLVFASNFLQRGRESIFGGKVDVVLVKVI